MTALLYHHNQPKSTIMRKGIVIPCYNEELRLQQASFLEFVEHHQEYLLCFVNDGSTDGTLRVLESMQSSQPERIMILDLSQNSGKAEAVRRGMLHMVSGTSVQSVAFMDADLSTGFDDMRRLMDYQQEHGKHVVVGSRKMGGPQQVRRSLFRRTASLAVGMFIRAIIGMPVRDTQCGAKVFSRSIVTEVFSEPFLSRWLFDMEVFIRMRNLYGQSVMDVVSELGLMSWEEVEGSKISWNDSVRFPMRLAEIAYDYKVRRVLAQMGGSPLLRRTAV